MQKLSHVTLTLGNQNDNPVELHFVETWLTQQRGPSGKWYEIAVHVGDIFTFQSDKPFPQTVQAIICVENNVYLVIRGADGTTIIDLDTVVEWKDIGDTIGDCDWIKWMVNHR